MNNFINNFTYSKVRKDLYLHNRRYSRENGEDMDDFTKYPYTFFKSRLYIECASLLVSFLQHTRITANQLSLFNAFLGPVSIFCFYQANISGYLFGLFIFVFLKGVIDWSDGALARLKGSCSELGSVLDSWSATVISYCFQICIGLFVYNMNDQPLFILIILATILIRAVDLRMFVQSTIGAEFCSGMNLSERLKRSETGDQRFVVSSSGLTVAFQILTKILDDRARMVDLISLLILIDLFIGNLYFSPFIVYLMLLGSVVKFLAGFYVIFSVNNFLKKNGNF